MAGNRKNAPGPPDRGGQRWEWLTLFGLALTVFHALALWYRWLRPDPAFLEFSTGVIGLLAIFSFLGYQTEGGKRFVLKLDDTLGLARWARSPARLCGLVWGLLGVLAVLLYLGSPLAAGLYRQSGVEAHENGEYSLAIRRFRQALSLEPGNARAHYNLANAYEAIQDYDQAIAEYQAALELDDAFWPSHNNLGRLYLVAREDPDAALEILLNGVRRVEDPLSKAVMTKNIAWAYFERGLPETALASLETVIEELQALQGEGQGVEGYLAESYQLLARIYGTQEDPESAGQAWQDSLGYALAVAESPACTVEGTRLPPDCLAAIRWAAEAREMLSQRR